MLCGLTRRSMGRRPPGRSLRNSRADGDVLHTAVEQPPAPLEHAIESRANARWLRLVGVGLIVLYAPTFRWLFTRWTLSVWHNAHGLFVLPLAAWLAAIELKRCRSL